jgi:DNA-binding Lrp family transcriptional regulator
MSIILGKTVPKDIDLQSTLTQTFEDFKIELNSNIFIAGRPGSGKTTLCKVLIEEALMLGYPCFVIDPKGDLANLAITLEIAQVLSIDKEKISHYQKLHKRFKTNGNISTYGAKIIPKIYNAAFKPCKETMDYAFNVHDNRVPLTVICLHFSDFDEETNLKVVRDILKYVNDNYKQSSWTRENKMILIDEVHKFLRGKEESTLKKEIYNQLHTLCRMTSREGKFIIVLCTQNQKDVEGKFLKAGGFSLLFNFEEEKNYRCTPLRWAGGWKFPYSMLPPGYFLVTRYPYSIGEASISKEEYYKINGLWDHISAKPAKIEPFQFINLNDEDYDIISCLNNISVEVEWNPSVLVDKLNKSEDEIKKYLDSLATNTILKAHGFYRIWLDYNKLGYFITAYFIAKGKGNWEEGVLKLTSYPEVVEVFEVKPHTKYLDENLIFKFRFRSFEDYFNFVDGKILKICDRGMGTEQRFREYGSESIELFIQTGDKEKLPAIPPEQIVSGCLACKTFSERPGCYIFPQALNFLNYEEKNTLKYLIELNNALQLFQKNSHYHHINVDQLYTDINQAISQEDIETTFIKDGLDKKDLINKIERYVKAGIIKGVFYELPWDSFGYKTQFILGQFDFSRSIEEQGKDLTYRHDVQEVHAIVGTYDCILKIRYVETPPRTSEFKLSELNPFEVIRPFKSGYRMKKS